MSGLENAIAAYQFSLACMAQLASSGVKHVVASPGFRSSPLLLAAQRTQGLQVISAVDERGAAFFALGLARAQRLPVALLCTSGTAVGNYLPAVMEAHHSQIPLLLLTGDRPQELVDTGANQCTEQNGVFGRFTRAAFDTAPPSLASHEQNQAGYLIGKAVARCVKPAAGPVHVNLRFREPFLPSPEECARLEANERPRAWSFFPSASGPGEDQAFAIQTVVRAAKRPLFVLGPGGYGQKLLGRLADLSARTGIPVAAEASSGLAFCQKAGNAKILHRAEPLFAAMESGKVPVPDLFIRVGAPPTGRAYQKLLASSGLPQIIFENWGESREPGFHPSIFVEGNIEAWLGEGDAWLEASAEAAWAEALVDHETAVEKRIEGRLREEKNFTEWHFHRAFEAVLGPVANIFIGNSMPIRDFNSVFPRTEKRLRIFCNRGLSGIDGLIASAAGVAYGSSRETHAVIGDLSSLHDLPSLALAASLRNKVNLTIWVMNNGGGEIFRLVQTANAGAPQDWFSTPQEIDFAAVAKSFRIPYLRVTDSPSLSDLEPALFSGSGIRLIEVLAAGEANTAIRRSMA